MVYWHDIGPISAKSSIKIIIIILAAYIVYLIIYYLAIPEVPSHFYVKYYVSQNIFKKNASYMVHLSN